MEAKETTQAKHQHTQVGERSLALRCYMHINSDSQKIESESTAHISGLFI